ncbi:hypothetical protein [Microbacterium sp. SORGH_AS_0888]|uniref:hypothetical protein n=1 Tax=Microbacterium sp. SORGH_AS_0888 TaxID=3041791 RepID=UPI002784177B|nr:hypothetical protein [Microbacterium sp. SORGH_AS_0888]MDQ1130453.1 hypothetical protein [Microbacterium sp. SORGH_AS_0888]
MGAAAAVLLATGVLGLVWIGVQIPVSVVGWNDAGPAVVAISRGLLAPGAVLIPFLASSILILRITHALADRRRTPLAKDVEARSDLVGWVCAVMAGVWAGAMQPGAWSRPEDHGWGLFAITVGLLAVTFQFFIGTMVVPDARDQLTIAQKALRAESKFLDESQAASLPSVRSAVRIVAIDAGLLLVFVPVTLGLIEGIARNSLESGVRTGGLALSLAFMSVYSVLLGQLAAPFSTKAARRTFTTVATVIGAVGWVAVTIFEIYGFFAVGGVGWLLWGTGS